MQSEGKNQNNLFLTLTQKLLLTRKEVCQLLNTGETTALRLLAKYNIQPIDLGKGRGNGLRWRTSEVIKLADILHTEAQTAKIRRYKKASPYNVLGKTASELFAEFNGISSVKAKVCNGN